MDYQRTDALAETYLGCSTRTSQTSWIESWRRDYRNHNVFVDDGREANRWFLDHVLPRLARSDRHDGGPGDRG